MVRKAYLDNLFMINSNWFSLSEKKPINYLENIIKDLENKTKNKIVIISLANKDKYSLEFYQDALFSTAIIEDIEKYLFISNRATRFEIIEAINTLIMLRDYPVHSITLPIFEDTKTSQNIEEQIVFEKNMKLPFITNYKRKEEYVVSNDYVSIVIVMFRYHEKMKKALQSLVNQNYKKKEIIVINNNFELSENQKQVTKLIEDLQESLKVKIVEIKTDIEVNANIARNMGLDVSKYELIKFFDDDDELYSNAITELVNAQKQEKTSVVFCMDRQQHSMLLNSNSIITGDFSQLLWARKWDILPSTSNSLFVKKVLEDEGKWDERFLRHQDYELFIRLARKYDFTRINKRLLDYEFDSRKRKAIIEIVKNAMRIILVQYKDDIDKYSYSAQTEIKNEIKKLGLTKI